VCCSIFVCLRFVADQDRKPKIAERRQIAQIINSPNRHLNVQEKFLLWTYRFSLVDDRKALTKFLRAVNYEDLAELKQALELMNKWAPIDIADALELLSASFTTKEVREYAVQQLERADNDELINYLLQLVQALRYEQEYPNELSKFLMKRCCGTPELANYLYWYMTVESATSGKYKQTLDEFIDHLVAATQSSDGSSWADMFVLQKRLIQQLLNLGEQARQNKGRVQQKIERMHALLQTDLKHLAHFPTPVRMPVRPEVCVTGIVESECTMFKSALAPMLASFNYITSSIKTSDIPSAPAESTSQSKRYKVIFKIGDDLRQDQLVIQMINLMDSLLKKVNLDLKLTPYRVLATSSEHGFVEFVADSHTLTSILADYNRDIKQFFHTKTPKISELAKVLDTFVKSCAGYCVITYLLGIGDRHLENVLLTEDGHLFHIDFGYIFGRDPKPFPPPMKLCKEMVLAMGGSESNLYMDFRRFCCLAFNILRKHANLILNLLSLMGDANIPNLSADLDKSLLKVQEKFRLDLEDEKADEFLLTLIDESVSALFPQLMEKIHKWALYWK